MKPKSEKRRINRYVKWVATLIALVLFVIIGTGKEPIALSNRAVVIGMAIDKTEDEKIEISTQILTSSTSDSPTNNSRVITAEGETVASALIKISEKTAKVVTLSHCNMVVLGSEILKDDAYSVLDYLMRNAYLSENAILVAAEGEGREILQTKVAFLSAAPFYIQQTISSYGSYKNIEKITIKDFAVNYHCLGKANWIPIVKKIETEKEIIPEGAGNVESDRKDYLFDMTDTAIIKGGSYVYTEGEDGTEAINYVLSKVERGSINVKGDNGTMIELGLLKKSAKKKYDVKTNTVKVEIELLTVLHEILDEKGNDKPVDKVELSPTEEKTATDDIKRKIEETFLRTQSHDVDVFEFTESFYRRNGKKEIPLSDIKLEVEVKLKYK